MDFILRVHQGFLIKDLNLSVVILPVRHIHYISTLFIFSIPGGCSFKIKKYTKTLQSL
jgi:hypothetical protein